MIKRYFDAVCKMIIAGLIVLIAVLAVSSFILSEADGEEDTVNEVSAFVGREFVSSFSEAEVVAELGRTYFDETEKEEILVKIANVLGISNHGEYTFKRQGEIVVSGFKIENNASQVYLEFVSEERKKSANIVELNQYIKVRICINDSVESALYYRNKLVDYFENEDLNITSKFSVCGEVTGILSDEEKENMAEHFIDKLNGNVVSSDIDDNNFAIYGYTEYFNDYIVYGDKKVNLTLIIEEDNDKDMSSVYMATPTI